MGVSAFGAASMSLSSGPEAFGAERNVYSKCSSVSEDKYAGTALYPPIEPFETGMLPVSSLHTIAYSIYGNPNGKPVVYVHGGPGGGTTPTVARYFDPKAYKIIVVDQRGCGKSTPFAELRENTTYDSIRDFEKLREKLGISKWQVFGGSWGSTLALAYSMEHPERVSELVLRGIFLLREKEIRWFYQGPGAGYLFPHEWAQYTDAIPESERGDMLAAYGRRLRGELGSEEMHRAALAWSLWEGRTNRLVPDPPEALATRYGDADFALAFARIENHYFLNRGFFPRDGFLLEPANLARIAHIPTVIIQGRYDVVCPAVSAVDLHRALPSAELHLTLAGHSGYEPENVARLVAATDAFRPV
jgi:proline iminopeptidase